MSSPDPSVERRVAEGAPGRLLYIDNLRLFVIVCVVMHHLAVICSGFGSFYYIEHRPLDPLSTVWFAFYLSLQQAYFMGLLFMIAGYFVGRSYARRGFGGFVGERFRRLMIPALITMVVISPFIEIVELRAPQRGFDIVAFLSGTGVMWFTVALFIFSLVYASMRRLTGNAAARFEGGRLRPTLARAATLALIIATFAFLIRTVQPIGTDVLNMQLCYFASYIVLFAMGIIAARTGLFELIGYRTGKRLLIGGVLAGFGVWLPLVAVATKIGGTSTLNGGLTWQSAAFSLWESSVALAVIMGLIAVFRERCGRQSRLVKVLSDNSFAVYMFHPPILVAVALLLSWVAIPPIVKWLMLCVICLPLCFAATHLVFRRVPLLKSVL